MDNASEISSREHVQRLYNKNVDLELKRRKSVQARVPLDHNLWQQMRENFEIILLKDHAFAEMNEVEFALWQLHYSRIEDMRSHYNAAVASAKNSPVQGGKTGPARPDRVAKIRSQFKTFLSEATGFYHDLMLKIRAKYGFPLGYVSDDPENEAILVSKDGNKSLELKKGLISCHRCLIYLGDLARYKGIYGDVESKIREFAAASSYYLQASTFCPSSGNPHHQLAILASYSNDEFVAIYRYFRSLGVENPFLMARDNLIIAFEKNRQSYTQLLVDSKTSATKTGPVKISGKGRGKTEARFSLKEHKSDPSPVKEQVSNTLDRLKAFTVKFVRLHGILFTRTSLETFEDVLSVAKIDFMELLSFHTEEQPKFGSDSAESGLFIIRLVAILIFTVQNANRESEDQSYADILQRTVLLQNAYTAAFEFMGHVIQRCVQLDDPLSSSLLPGVLVFIEWLACHPDVVTVNDEEKEAGVRSFFWKNCISFFNIILSTSLKPDDEDEAYLFNLSSFDDSGTSGQLALWEDFELRGFSPLHQAQQFLDFSRKSFFGKDGGYKERKARVHRIIAAGKVFLNVVQVGKQVVFFDSKLKKFSIGCLPQIPCDVAISDPEISIPNVGLDMSPNEEVGARIGKPDGEDEEEEIVFKPPIVDKHAGDVGSVMDPGFILHHVSNVPVHEVHSYIDPVSVSHGLTGAPSHAFKSDGVAQHVQPVMPSTSEWLFAQQSSIMDGVRNFSLLENGNIDNPKPREYVQKSEPMSYAASIMQPIKHTGGNMQAFVTTTPEAIVSSKPQLNVSTEFAYDASVKSMQVLPVGTNNNPVSRPLRHNGPPPGFTPYSSTHFDEPNLGFTAKDDFFLLDDYSWLDGYEMPSTTPVSGFQAANPASQAYSDVSKTNSMAGVVTFPFPGKQPSAFQVPPGNTKGWQGYQSSHPVKMFHEQQLQKGNQHSIPLPEQCQGQSLWGGRFLV